LKLQAHKQVHVSHKFVDMVAFMAFCQAKNLLEVSFQDFISKPTSVYESR